MKAHIFVNWLKGFEARTPNTWLKVQKVTYKCSFDP